MSGAMSGLDAWLEAPYVDAARAEADFEAWCEHTGTDPDSAGAWERFEADQEEAYDAAMEAHEENRRDAAED